MALMSDQRETVSAGAAISLARQAYGYSIRALARRSGVSAGQISRLESGEVQRPAVETLVALARGLDRNPVLLMIVAGHISGDEARGHLTRLLADGSEFAMAWEYGPADDSLRQMRAAAANTSIDED